MEGFPVPGKWRRRVLERQNSEFLAAGFHCKRPLAFRRPMRTSSRRDDSRSAPMTKIIQTRVYNTFPKDAYRQMILYPGQESVSKIQTSIHPPFQQSFNVSQRFFLNLQQDSAVIPLPDDKLIDSSDHICNPKFLQFEPEIFFIRSPNAKFDTISIFVLPVNFVEDEKLVPAISRWIDNVNLSKLKQTVITSNFKKLDRLTYSNSLTVDGFFRFRFSLFRFWRRRNSNRSP